MLSINYPEPAFRIKKENEKEFIFDAIRRKWLLLTPEEWVRQNFIQYLLQEMNYPQAFIALEKEIQLGELRKRFDILVYDRTHQPWMMIECKAPTVPLTKDVLVQLLRYNITVPVEYMAITNGSNTIAWRKIGLQLEVIDRLPVL